jgi:prepilin-type processing-associated H-X9-DG protein/prepilin-type N-terminal cleavage/methylation domain-containing protein
MASPSQPRDGFTLVEVLVVIGVIIVLAALLFPVMARVRQGGQRTVCLNNMKQLGLAFQQYTIDHDSRYPGAGQFQKWGNGGHWVKGTNTGTMFELANPENPTGTQADVQGGALYPYAKNPNVYICPSNPYSADVTNLSYSMNCAIAGMSSRARMRAPSEINLLVDEGYANDGFFYVADSTNSTDSLAQFHLNSGNILFADGHARSYTYTQYPLSRDNGTLKVRRTGIPRFLDTVFGSAGYYNPSEIVTTPPQPPPAFGTCALP